MTCAFSDSSTTTATVTRTHRFDAGKSYLIRRILASEEDIFGQKFDSISVFSTCASSQYYSLSATNDRVKVEQGLTPGEAFEQLASSDKQEYPRQLWLLEDQFTTARNVSDPRLVELFTSGTHVRTYVCRQQRFHRLYTPSGSHHLNLSILATGQSLFGSRDLRTITLQCTLLILWPSVRDATSLSVLSRQVFPHAHHSFLSSALQLANVNNSSNFKRPLFVNVSPSFFSERLRVASGALPTDGDLTFYLPARKSRH